MTAADVVRKMYGAMARGDMPAALETLDRCVEWTEAAGFPYAGTYVGRKAVLEGVFAKLGAHYDGFAAVPDVVIDHGDQAAAMGWYTGTSRATGQRFRARYVHWFTVADGHITRFEQVCDTAQVATPR